MKSTLDKLANNPLQVALGVALLLGVAYLLIRRTVGEAIDTAGGVLSGNNALTEGTAYEDKGAAGTLGAAADTVSGGLLSWLGEAIGGIAADQADSLRAFFGKPPGGSDVFHTVTFPDGQRHAIAHDSIDSGGKFTYAGARYQLYQDGAGMYFARVA